MKKIKLKEGGLAVLILAMMLVALTSRAAHGFAGILRVHKTNILSGAVTERIFAGTAPNQASAATGGGSTLLVFDTHYSVDNDSSPTYRIYNIYNSPAQPAYLQIIKAATYRILQADLGTTVPVTTTYDTATFFTLGAPATPTITSINVGYETAKANLTYSSNYEYSGIDVAVYDVDAAAFLGATTPVSGTPADYKIGQLIDGRILATDADGKPYRFDVRGKVNGVDPSSWANQTFTTTALGDIAATQTFTLTLRSNVGATPAGPGINSFAMPFPPNATTNSWYVYLPGVGGAPDTPINVGVGGTNAITNTYHLVKAINTAAIAQGAAGDVVSTFGSWEAGAQTASGIMIAGNNPDGSAQAALQAATLNQGVGYQVYIGNPPGGTPLAAGYTLNLVIRNTAP